MMPSNWVTVDGFGKQGMQPDINPSHRAPGAMDLLTNCRPVGSNIRNAGGFSDIGLTSQSGNTLFYQSAYGDHFLFSAGDAIYVHEGVSWDDISGAAISFNPGLGEIGDRWSGGYLQQTMTFCCKGIVRNYVRGADTDAQPLKWDVSPESGDDTATWESLGKGAFVMRPFKNFMFAGHIYNPGTGNNFPQRVLWSHPVEPLERPEIWVPSAENLAGSVDLGESSGEIVDMVPLRNAMIIYKDDSIWTAEYVGGQSIFRFREVLTSRGISARDAVVEYNGLHYCLGVEDIFIFDGNTARSLVWGPIKRHWLLDRDNTRAGNCFTTLDTKHDEVLFHYVSLDSQNEWPDKTLAYCMTTGAWTLRDYGKHMRHSNHSKSVWDVNATDYLIYALTASKVVDLETGPAQDGVPTPAHILRTGLLADPGHNWIQVDSVKIGMTANAGQTFKVRLGGQVSPSSPIVWRTQFDIDPSTDYKTDCSQNDNFIAFEITASVTAYWQLSNVDLKVQRSAERG